MGKRGSVSISHKDTKPQNVILSEFCVFVGQKTQIETLLKKAPKRPFFLYESFHRLIIL